MMKILSVDKLGEELFSILAGNEVETCRSACRISTEKLSDDNSISVMNFDSVEFERRIVMGEIMIQDIRDALQFLT
jgi:hypothetical protein